MSTKVRRIVWKKRLKQAASMLIYRCLLIGLPSKRPAEDDGRIAVVCLGALGDFIAFCPAARALAQQGKRLILICREKTGIQEFADRTGHFERMIELPHRFRERPKNLFRLKKIQAGTVIAAPAGRHILSDLYVLAITAHRRVLPDTLLGCSLPRLKNLVDRKADVLVPVTARNEWERCREYLNGAGYHLPILTPYELDTVQSPQDRENIVAVFPGAGGGAVKQWPVERFAWVLERLYEEKECEVFVCGTEREREVGEQLCAELPFPAKNLCGTTTIKSLLELLGRCSLVLANDSGSAHMAIACGTPTVIICGCWEYGRFYPNPTLPHHCRPVVPSLDKLNCAPCGESQPDCAKGEILPCVLSVDKETVLYAVHRVQTDGIILWEFQ